MNAVMIEMTTRLRQSLADWMPYLSVPLVTLIIAEIKRLRPKWKTQYRHRWPLVAVAIGILLNVLGISIKPQEVVQVAFSTEGPVKVDTANSTLSFLKIVGIGIMAGLAGKGARDWNKDRVLRKEQKQRLACNSLPPRRRGRRKGD